MVATACGPIAFLSQKHPEKCLPCRLQGVASRTQILCRDRGSVAFPPARCQRSVPLSPPLDSSLPMFEANRAPCLCCVPPTGVCGNPTMLFGLMITSFSSTTHPWGPFCSAFAWDWTRFRQENHLLVKTGPFDMDAPVHAVFGGTPAEFALACLSHGKYGYTRVPWVWFKLLA
jgi:hypothetical protein